MTPLCKQTLEANIRNQLSECERRWMLPGLQHSVRIEWSRRFRRSLGRVHLERRVVRLSADLARAPLPLLLEVLCHEVAHLAARDLHGSQCPPHGPEGERLVQAAGFEPRRRIPWSLGPLSHQRTTRRYLHSCPVCQSQRTAWRPVRQWRCARCVAGGLPGQLDIRSQPPAKPI